MTPNDRLTHTFVVTVNVDAGQRDTAQYIREAIRCYGGGGHPDSPFFGLQPPHVKVKSIPKPITLRSK